MRRYETLETLFGKVDLSFAEAVLNESYHVKDSVGRPPRKPLGVFKAHLLRRLRHVPSDRMLVRQLWKDPRLRRICDIGENEHPYGIAVLSRFRKRVGPERLMRIVDDAVETLVEKRRIKGETLAMDSTFIKAHSRRNLDNRTGYSDPESRVGRAVKTRDLGLQASLDGGLSKRDAHSHDSGSGKREREETLAEHAGEDQADSQTVCSQIEKRDS
jgi:hypothetical protein